MTERDLFISEFEEWLPTKYPGYYVSRNGLVWGPGRNGKGGVIKDWPTNHGHRYVDIHVDGKKKRVYVHRLVAEAFCENRNNYPIVRHLNDDPEDNYADNLAWGTQIDNVHDMKRNGNAYKLTKEDIRKANKIRMRGVRAIDIRTGDIYDFESIAEASRVLRLRPDSIHSRLKRRKRCIDSIPYDFYYTD